MYLSLSFSSCNLSLDMKEHAHVVCSFSKRYLPLPAATPANCAAFEQKVIKQIPKIPFRGPPYSILLKPVLYFNHS